MTGGRVYTRHHFSNGSLAREVIEVLNRDAVEFQTPHVLVEALRHCSQVVLEGVVTE